MGPYFLDTSALVKRYVAETGHTWTVRLCRPSARNQIYVAQPALVEVVAALCRMVRAQPPRLNATTRERLIARFRQHCEHQYILVPVTDATFTQAGDLCRSHPLRLRCRATRLCAYCTQ